jgi:hypothetical protein
MSSTDGDVKPRSLLPKEHGVYAEAGFPIVTGLVMSRIHPAAVLFGVAVIAAFLAHEPLLVVLGHRGQRVQHDHGQRATRRAILLGAMAVLSGVIAIGLAPQEASLWLFIPVVLGVLMVPRILGGTMKTLVGELVAGLALTAMVLPIGLSGGVVPLPLAVSAAVVWALTFTISNLAVRAIIRPHLRRAKGEDVPESTGPGSLRGRMDRNTERTVVIVLCVWAIMGVILALTLTQLSTWAVLAAIPGTVAGLVLGIRKISARSLRKVGWTLVGVYMSTLALLVVAALTASV